MNQKGEKGRKGEGEKGGKGEREIVVSVLLFFDLMVRPRIEGCLSY